MRPQQPDSEIEGVQIETGFRWWFWPYIYMLAIFCSITGMQPDEKKLKVKVINGIWVRAK